MDALPHSTSVERLQIRRLQIDTYQEPVIYMPAECPVCRSEGFEAQTRIRVTLANRSIIATLNVVGPALVGGGEAGLSEAAWRLLGAREGDQVTLEHPEPLESLSHVRAKAYGRRLADVAFDAIIRDVAAGLYSDVHLAAFVTASAGDRLDLGEMIGLTKAMIAAGDRLDWGPGPVADKHCVGGLPGNRTTLLVVPIVAASGLRIPKTSSRAITSPAGSADAMETLAPVELDLAAMRRVVEREGGCIVWGGAARLSPADDVLIRVERPLDLDSPGQMVASILSKKAAAGSTDVLIDIPVGPTAKVRSTEGAERLRAELAAVGEAVGLRLWVVATDGAQPVGRGVGPALEARDALAVLRGEPTAPADLRDRALALAGALLEFVAGVRPGDGLALARSALDSGAALRKFEAICEAQGGMRVPPVARFTDAVASPRAGVVTAIDNRRLARVAKLAGAPKAPAAGLELHTPLGAAVERGEQLFTVHAEAPGELAYALAYASTHADIVCVSPRDNAPGSDERSP
jgi:thymidine phosphorylase